MNPANLYEIVLLSGGLFLCLGALVFAFFILLVQTRSQRQQREELLLLMKSERTDHARFINETRKHYQAGIESFSAKILARDLPELTDHIVQKNNSFVFAKKRGDLVSGGPNGELMGTQAEESVIDIARLRGVSIDEAWRIYNNQDSTESTVVGNEAID